MTAAARTLAALVFANLALTFDNLWPTPGIAPALRLSVEVAFVVAALVVVQPWPRGRRWVGPLAVCAMLVLVIARYAQVTLSGLFGRPIDMVAEARHLPAVADLVLAAINPWFVLGLAVTGLLIVGLIAWVTAWSVRVIDGALDARPVRRVVGGAALVTIALYGFGESTAVSLGLFAAPAMPGIARQVGLASQHLTGAPQVFASALSASDLSKLQGADVFVVFVESYGATAFDAGDMSGALAPLDAAVRRAGWSAASGFVTSPTFGGASWLAHTTAMTGVEVRGLRAYDGFVAGGGETLADRFRGVGYRTIALVPGIRGPWPEGDALHVDRIVPAAELIYAGPHFGWFEIPDQASLAWLLANELAAPARDPVFVLFPTIMSHAPFVPVPDYVADWSRLLEADAFAPVAPPGLRPFDGAAWRINYQAAIAHQLQILAGFVGQRAAADTLLIVLGDHQPAAIVSGPGARWDVPVHVIASRPGLLAPFLKGGFAPGLRPRGASLGGMATVPRLLLEGFDGG